MQQLRTVDQSVGGGSGSTTSAVMMPCTLAHVPEACLLHCTMQRFHRLKEPVFFRQAFALQEATAARFHQDDTAKLLEQSALTSTDMHASHAGAQAIAHHAQEQLYANNVEMEKDVELMHDEQ
jgi:hypothetical protein